MNVLIGGTGFIGAALAEALVKNGEEVISVSRSGCGNVSGVRYEACDITDTEKLSGIIGQGEDIFILTGQVGPGFDAEKEKDNLMGIAGILVRFPGKRVFYVSSAYVYGNTDSPANEAHPCHPIESYSKFKFEAERLLQESLPDIVLTIVRLANVYGSPKNRGVIGLAMRKLFESDGKPLVINGDGSQKRDYVFLDDVAEAMVAIKRKSGASDTVNIANGESIPLLRVLGMISGISGKEIPFEVSNIFPDEIRDMYVSNRKLAEVYGYEPETPFEEGIRKTIKRYERAQSLKK
jgi:UDP-glucose 4-epimerase